MSKKSLKNQPVSIWRINTFCRKIVQLLEVCIPEKEKNERENIYQHLKAFINFRL